MTVLAPDFEEGDTLIAEMTGRTYTVRSIEDGKVHVTGLPPVDAEALQRDINAGKITVLR